MTSNLPCIVLVYILDMCIMHMPNLDYACMQIVSQGQWNKLYKHVHVLRCNPFVMQDVNPAKLIFYCKAKVIRGHVFY